MGWGGGGVGYWLQLIPINSKLSMAVVQELLNVS